MTCSHTLLDLPSAKERLLSVDNLWRRTAGYLIIVEAGTNAGFQVRLRRRGGINLSFHVLLRIIAYRTHTHTRTFA